MFCCSWTRRDIALFLAGAELFHTLVHIVIYFSGLLPIKLFIEWTAQSNMIAIAVNALITLALLWLACKSNGKNCSYNKSNDSCC
jgi:hypothetical protein